MNSVEKKTIENNNSYFSAQNVIDQLLLSYGNQTFQAISISFSNLVRPFHFALNLNYVPKHSAFSKRKGHYPNKVINLKDKTNS